MADFNPGDVVQLKSGGPKMTISKLFEFQGHMEAGCDWFEGTKQQSGSFPVTSLKHFDETPPKRAQAGGAGGSGGPWS